MILLEKKHIKVIKYEELYHDVVLGRGRRSHSWEMHNPLQDEEIQLIHEKKLPLDIYGLPARKSVDEGRQVFKIRASRVHYPLKWSSIVNLL
jgi:hypothetical protein